MPKGFGIATQNRLKNLSVPKCNRKADRHIWFPKKAV
jgi:hypothetical protein